MLYQFDQFTVDTLRFELRKGSVALAIEPQVLELLLLLVENSERLVTKNEIIDSVWKGRMVSESALSSRIKAARQLLGDDGKSQSFIKTVHGKGFRFVAEVTKVTLNPETKPSASSIAAEPNTETESSSLPSFKKTTVVVLPFSNLSSNADQEYFSDGITADIIAHLSKHKWLSVTARNTAFGYKNKAVNVRELGSTLNVQYVVEGTVQKQGDKVRITVNLIDAQTGNHTWAERYNREIEDIFSLQDEITETIVARLEPEIGFAERNRVMMLRPTNLKAWDYFHLGTFHFFKFTGEDNELAQEYLLKSQTLDQHFGEAYAWWAYAVILGMVYWNTEPTQDLLDKALNACNKALSIDSQNAVFYALKARVLLARKEYDDAIAENKIAIRLNPTLSAAYCGLGDSLAYEGNFPESMENFNKAIALSPNDPQLWAFYTYGALALLFSQQYEQAIEWANNAANIPNCQYWTTAHKVVALAFLGRQKELEEAKAKLLKENPNFSKQFVRTKLFYIKKSEQINQYIEGLRLAGID